MVQKLWHKMKRRPKRVGPYCRSQFSTLFLLLSDFRLKMITWPGFCHSLFNMSLCLMIIFFAFDKWQYIYYKWFTTNVVTVLLKKASLLCISVAKSGLNGSKVKDFLRSTFCIFRIALLARQNLCCISPIIGCEMVMLELMCTV